MWLRNNGDNPKKIFFRPFVLSAFITILFIVTSSLSAQPLREDTYRKAVTRDIPYGQENGSVGLVYQQGFYRVGPESFSHDADGNLYVCDTVNKSIQIFSPTGMHLHKIPLGQELEANDIVLDNPGHIYIYDDLQGKLHQYNRIGNSLNVISVDSSRWQSRGPMHIVGNEIYIRSSNQEDVLIGRIVDDILAEPAADDISRPLQKGIHGVSGKRYLVTLQRMEKGTIDIISTTGATIKSIDLELSGIVSLSFLSEGRKGDFYIQTERLDYGKIFLEVHKFDSEGTYLTTALIPENDYSSWSVKLLSLDEHGNIFQFLPSKEKGQINIFLHK